MSRLNLEARRQLSPCISTTECGWTAVFPVEFVVRGFITGSTDTSLWTVYTAGKRQYCGNSFPDGLRKNQR